jgi:hypothetical protein
MEISGMSDISTYLAQSASNMKGEKISQAISTAVLKQTLDSETNVGMAIVRMIQNSPGSGNPGGIVDIRA